MSTSEHQKFPASSFPNQYAVVGSYPEKTLQFGEGNFLRAFANWMIDLANESGLDQGSIVLCQPIVEGMADKLNRQDGIYTVMLRGIENGAPTERIRKITSVSRCINPYSGYDTVLEFFTDSIFGDFERELIDNKIIPVVDLPKEDLNSFAADVSDRFKNPYIKHYLYDITLNNCSKFSARCVPTIQDSHWYLLV